KERRGCPGHRRSGSDAVLRTAMPGHEEAERRVAILIQISNSPFVVIASEAKQSRNLSEEVVWIASSLALLAGTSREGTTSHPRGTIRARAMRQPALEREEGAGNTGCRLHP